LKSYPQLPCDNPSVSFADSSLYTREPPRQIIIYSACRPVKLPNRRLQSLSILHLPARRRGMRARSFACELRSPAVGALKFRLKFQGRAVCAPPLQRSHETGEQSHSLRSHCFIYEGRLKREQTMKALCSDAESWVTCLRRAKGHWPSALP